MGQGCGSRYNKGEACPASTASPAIADNGRQALWSPRPRFRMAAARVHIEAGRSDHHRSGPAPHQVVADLSCHARFLDASESWRFYDNYKVTRYHDLHLVRNDCRLPSRTRGGLVLFPETIPAGDSEIAGALLSGARGGPGVARAGVTGSLPAGVRLIRVARTMPRARLRRRIAATRAARDGSGPAQRAAGNRHRYRNAGRGAGAAHAD